MLLIEKTYPWRLLIEKHIRGSTPRGTKKEGNHPSINHRGGANEFTTSIEGTRIPLREPGLAGPDFCLSCINTMEFTG